MKTDPIAPSQGHGWVRFQPALSRKVGQISTGVDKDRWGSPDGSEETAEHGARYGVKIKKMWDSADGYIDHAICAFEVTRRRMWSMIW
jgi:hypothetical protein